MLLAQLLGGLFGIMIVWIPVSYFERKEQLRIDNDLLEITKEESRRLAEVRRKAK